MLAEMLAWLLTPASATARRLGHLSESIAIGARYRRCRKAWSPHLAASRQALLDSAHRAPGHRTALVLGSGHLLDIPLDELAGLFESVWLVDIVHPRSARRAAKRHANVRLIEHDVTEYMETRSGNPAVPTRFLDDTAIDWVASVNLLSQLAPRNLGDSAVGAALMARHLDWLRRFTCPVCLIADLEQVRQDRHGEIIEARDFRPVLAGWAVSADWRWNLAPAGELPEGETAWHRIVLCTRQGQQEYQRDIAQAQ